MKSNYFTKTLLPNFKTLGLLFLTVLLFSTCGDDPDEPNPIPQGKEPAENLTFQKFYRTFFRKYNQCYPNSHKNTG